MSTCIKDIKTLVMLMASFNHSQLLRMQLHLSSKPDHGQLTPVDFILELVKFLLEMYEDGDHAAMKFLDAKDM